MGTRVGGGKQRPTGDSKRGGQKAVTGSGRSPDVESTGEPAEELLEEEEGARERARVREGPEAPLQAEE